MSSRQPWPKVCSSEEALALDCGKFCAPAAKATESPIDEYYAYARKVITIGTQDALEANDVLGRVLILGLVSGVEQFFRSVLARTIH